MSGNILDVEACDDVTQSILVVVVLATSAALLLRPQTTATIVRARASCLVLPLPDIYCFLNNLLNNRLGT